MRAWSLGLFASLLAITAPDMAAPRPPSATPSTSSGSSIGAPNGGRLDGGAQLHEARHIRVVPCYAASQARWGLPSLVGLLDRAARRVARRYPDAVLAVGDLSRKGGGGLERHRSHESGRDADLAFYARTATDRPLVADRFVAFDGSGAARSVAGAVFDDVRNWALVEALLDDPAARVSHIFISSPLRARLLRFAELNNVPRAVRERAAEVMMQPRHALPHDDHFHIRIACPPAQVGTCVEEAAMPVPRARPLLAGFRQRSGSPVAPSPAGAVVSPAWQPASARATSTAAASTRGQSAAPRATAPVAPIAPGGVPSVEPARRDPVNTTELRRLIAPAAGMTQVSDRLAHDPWTGRVLPLANAEAPDNVAP